MSLNIYDYIKLVAYCNLENTKYTFSSETAGLLGLLVMLGARSKHIKYKIHDEIGSFGSDRSISQYDRFGFMKNFGVE